MAKESKKAAKAKKKERGSIPPPFTVSTEELYSILEAWVKDGVVVFPECKCEPIDEEKKVHFTAGTTGGVITMPWIVMY